MSPPPDALDRGDRVQRARQTPGAGVELVGACAEETLLRSSSPSLAAMLPVPDPLAASERSRDENRASARFALYGGGVAAVEL